jgi:hypothetical protein
MIKKILLHRDFTPNWGNLGTVFSLQIFLIDGDIYWSDPVLLKNIANFKTEFYKTKSIVLEHILNDKNK